MDVVEDFTEYEWLIIYKMYVGTYIGKKHTPMENIPKGFPSHLKKEIKKALKSLIKKGVVVAKPTSHGTDVFINPKYPNIIEIMERSVEVVKELQKQKKIGIKKDRGLSF